jgi:ABC-2 type transport system ATP-binding protein
MITIESVTRTYGAFTAVNDVSFTAQPGRVTGFLGPNGAGKSTTMRIMVGLTRPTSGTATISGRSYLDLPNPGLEVGVLLDASAQHAGRTGREILTIAQRFMGVPRNRVEAMLDLVSLTPEEASRRVRDYSLGMRQRLGIATALIGEPTGVDPRRAGQRPGPGRHPLDAWPAARLRRPRWHRPALLPPAPRDRGHRPTTSW